VKKIARPEVRMFWYSSRPITLSVSQLVYLGPKSTLCTKEEGGGQNVLLLLPSNHLVCLPVGVPRVKEYTEYKRGDQ
jgi:hypothetical protein